MCPLMRKTFPHTLQVTAALLPSQSSSLRAGSIGRLFIYSLPCAPCLRGFFDCACTPFGVMVYQSFASFRNIDRSALPWLALQKIAFSAEKSPPRASISGQIGWPSISQNRCRSTVPLLLSSIQTVASVEPLRSGVAIRVVEGCKSYVVPAITIG